MLTTITNKARNIALVDTEYQ